MFSSLSNHQADAVNRLLAQAQLPTSDLGAVDWFALEGLADNETVVGVGGLERCGKSLLLRSLVVAEERRGEGIAHQLVLHLHDIAIAGGNETIWLMTTDAAPWFADRFGYQVVDRSDVVPDIRRSSQFSGVCPDSATLMRIALTP